MAPLLTRSSGGLGLLPSVTGSDVDLDSIGWTAAEADEAVLSRSVGMGGGTTLGRLWSITDLAALAGCMTLTTLLLGDVVGEPDGEVGVLILSERSGPALLLTLTLIFLPLAECHALQ